MSKLDLHRGQVFSLIEGQCTNLLQEKMEQELSWDTVSTSFDPVMLYKLITKTVLGQTEDQYPFATVYDQQNFIDRFSTGRIVK